MSLGEIEPPIEFEPDSFDPQIALNAEVLDRIAAALCLRLRPWLLSITNKEVEMAGKPTLRLPLIALPILLLTALPGWLANSALDAPASVSETSPLGNYLIADCGQTISGAYSATVFINGKNAATLDSTLSHGGVIIGGSGNVVIGDTVVTAPFIAPAPLAGSKWISFKIPAAERYTGWQCIAHFDDGSVLTGTFNSDNLATFANPSGSTCTRVEIPLPNTGHQPSVTDRLLSLIVEGSQG